MDDNPNDGFHKLSFLLSNPPFPPETFGNLLLLHCKYGYYDLAADIMAENSQLTFKFLAPVPHPPPPLSPLAPLAPCHHEPSYSVDGD